MTFKHLLAASIVVFTAIQTAEAAPFNSGISRSQLSRPVYHSASRPATPQAQANSEPVTVTVRCGVTDPQSVAASTNCQCADGTCRHCQNCGGCDCSSDNCKCGPCTCDNSCNCGTAPCTCARTASHYSRTAPHRRISQPQIAYAGYARR